MEIDNTHWHVSTDVYEWWHHTHSKLSQFIWQQIILLCKQTCQCHQFFNRKAIDGISCVPCSVLKFKQNINAKQNEKDCMKNQGLTLFRGTGNL